MVPNSFNAVAVTIAIEYQDDLMKNKVNKEALSKKGVSTAKMQKIWLDNSSECVICNFVMKDVTQKKIICYATE